MCVAAIGAEVPFVLQDYPQSTGVIIAPSVIVEIVKRLPSCVMLKHEDWPGLAKIAEVRAASQRGDTRRISILVGNGAIMLPEELGRGVDGAMTGFSYPEMMVEVCRAHFAGKLERAADLFDAYLPLAHATSCSRASGHGDPEVCAGPARRHRLAGHAQAGAAAVGRATRRRSDG